MFAIGKTNEFTSKYYSHIRIKVTLWVPGAIFQFSSYSQYGSCWSRLGLIQGTPTTSISSWHNYCITVNHTETIGSIPM